MHNSVYNDNHKYSALSLIEIVLVIGLFGAVMSVLVPFTLKQIRENKVFAEKEVLESTVFTQQQNAYAGKDGYAYGVKFFTDGYEIFQGDSYASLVSSERFYFKNGVEIVDQTFSVSGDELNFAIGEFKPADEGYVELSDGVNSYKVYVNSEGLVESY